MKYILSTNVNYTKFSYSNAANTNCINFDYQTILEMYLKAANVKNLPKFVRFVEPYLNHFQSDVFKSGWILRSDSKWMNWIKTDNDTVDHILKMQLYLQWRKLQHVI